MNLNINNIATMDEIISKRNGRILGVLLFLFEIGIMFAYGFGGYFTVEQASIQINSKTVFLDQSNKFILYIFTAILAILGYGLLIGYSQNSAIAGLTTTLIVISITVQLGPLLLSFWDQVFNGFSTSVPLSLATQRQSMVLCTSLLVALTSLSGRLGGLQTTLVTFIFNWGWTLSFKVTEKLSVNQAPQSPAIFDDNGTNYVYVFAGFFALSTALLLNCKQGKVAPQGSRHSAYIGMIGTGFIFATFPFSGILWPSGAASNIYRRFESPLNIYFALTASVIVTYITATAFGNLKIGVRQSLIGVLSGGVTISVVSGVINNIGACIAIGAISGFISGFWLQVIHPRLNRYATIDHMGIFGPILICSVLGGLGLSPAMYQSFTNLSSNLNTLNNAQITDNQSIIYQLAYIGIAAGSGLIFGWAAGLFSVCFRNPGDDFEFKKIINPDFGLYNQEKAEKAAVNREVTHPETNNVLRGPNL